MQNQKFKSAGVLSLLALFLYASAVHAQPVCESASSDPDNDGFGWENNETCVVSASTPTTSATTLSTGSSSVGTTPVCESALSDSDGDGFGWEFNRSCRVAGTSTIPTSASGTSSTTPDCVSANTDSDGDGFGWENNQTCVVPKVPVATPYSTSSSNFPLPEEKVVLQTPGCSDQRFDPDGDGYGWENSRSCTFRNAGDGGASITDVILVTGQSNALGAETLPYQPYDPALDSPVRRVYAYSQNGWGIAGLHQIWDRGWYPRSDIAGDPANNFGFHFGKNLVRRDATAVIGIIMVTAPGAGISHWDRPGDFFTSIDSRVRAALDALPGNPKVSGILWHQGETDFYGNDFYSNKLQALIGNFRAQDWLADDSVFICGETLNAPVNTRLNALNTDGDSATGCVAGSDLESVGDDIHFDAASLRTLGARYAEKYQSLRAN